MKKLLFSALTVLSASALFAVDYAAVSFSSTGTDTYADGTPVLDGEIYALVWTADGNFEGLNLDGTPVDANDAVVVALPLAKGEGVIVNIEETSSYLKSGTLATYLVDTRTFVDGEAKVAGSLKHVNATAKLDAEVKVSTGSVPAAVNAGKVAKGKAVASALPGDIQKPKITKMDLTDENVILTVSDTDARLNYVVQGGTTPAASGATGTPKAGNGTIKLVYPKSAGGNFFKVIRK